MHTSSNSYPYTQSLSCHHMTDCRVMGFHSAVKMLKTVVRRLKPGCICDLRMRHISVHPNVVSYSRSLIAMLCHVIAIMAAYENWSVSAPKCLVVCPQRCAGLVHPMHSSLRLRARTCMLGFNWRKCRFGVVFVIWTEQAASTSCLAVLP